MVDDGIVLDGDFLEDIESFTYLGSFIAKDGVADKTSRLELAKQGQRFLP